MKDTCDISILTAVDKNMISYSKNMTAMHKSLIERKKRKMKV